MSFSVAPPSSSSALAITNSRWLSVPPSEYIQHQQRGNSGKLISPRLRSLFSKSSATASHSQNEVDFSAQQRLQERFSSAYGPIAPKATSPTPCGWHNASSSKPTSHSLPNPKPQLARLKTSGISGLTVTRPPPLILNTDTPVAPNLSIKDSIRQMDVPISMPSQIGLPSCNNGVAFLTPSISTLPKPCHADKKLSEVIWAELNLMTTPGGHRRPVSMSPPCSATTPTFARPPLCKRSESEPVIQKTAEKHRHRPLPLPLLPLRESIQRQSIHRHSIHRHGANRRDTLVTSSSAPSSPIVSPCDVNFENSPCLSSNDLGASMWMAFHSVDDLNVPSSSGLGSPTFGPGADYQPLSSFSSLSSASSSAYRREGYVHIGDSPLPSAPVPSSAKSVPARRRPRPLPLLPVSYDDLPSLAVPSMQLPEDPSSSSSSSSFLSTTSSSVSIGSSGSWIHHNNASSDHLANFRETTSFPDWDDRSDRPATSGKAFTLESLWDYANSPCDTRFNDSFPDFTIPERTYSLGWDEKHAESCARMEQKDEAPPRSWSPDWSALSLKKGLKGDGHKRNGSELGRKLLSKPVNLRKQLAGVPAMIQKIGPKPDPERPALVRRGTSEKAKQAIDVMLYCGTKENGPLRDQAENVLKVEGGRHCEQVQDGGVWRDVLPMLRQLKAPSVRA